MSRGLYLSPQLTHPTLAGVSSLQVQAPLQKLLSSKSRPLLHHSSMVFLEPSAFIHVRMYALILVVDSPMRENIYIIAL